MTRYLSMYVLVVIFSIHVNCRCHCAFNWGFFSICLNRLKQREFKKNKSGKYFRMEIQKKKSCIIGTVYRQDCPLSMCSLKKRCIICVWGPRPHYWMTAHPLARSPHQKTGLFVESSANRKVKNLCLSTTRNLALFVCTSSWPLQQRATANPLLCIGVWKNNQIKYLATLEWRHCLLSFFSLQNYSQGLS